MWSVQREVGLEETIKIWISSIYPINKNTKLFIFGIEKLKFKKLINFYKKYNIFFFR